MRNRLMVQLKIWLILDLENLNGKSYFYTFWHVHKVQQFPLDMYIFGQSFCFLGPRQLFLRKVDIH